ncbi:MAG: hypothetical protein LUH14_10645 [Clostridiaceae bacterium]|nr:hypothetical protein [Clostridiaceae bacterium]
MTFKRGYHSIFMFLLISQFKRAKYLKKHNIMGSIGENCQFGPWLIPLYPELIRMGDNVLIHRSTKLIPHDGINTFLKRIYPNADFGHGEKLEPIEIGNNVSFSYNTVVVGGVKIGNNVLITAGTVVESDIPDNSVVQGVPGKVVGKLSMYSAVRQMKKDECPVIKNQHLTEQDINDAWKRFDEAREKKAKA